MTLSFAAPDQVIARLQWRYAVKQFDPTQKIPDGLWDAIEAALVLSPSSFGLQPWKFFVIRNAELRNQLLPHSSNQTQVVDASHLVVLAVKQNLGAGDVDRYIQSIAQIRQTPIEALEDFGNLMKGFLADPQRDTDAWARRQVYIALGQLLTTAAMLGVDACPMEGFTPAKYDEILGLDQMGYASLVICPVGYRAADDPYASLAKVRFARGEMVQHLG